MACPSSASTLSIRVSASVRNQLESLASATGRTKSFLAAKGIEDYLLTQAWQIKSIKMAVKKADSKDAKFVNHNEVVDLLKSW